MAVALNHSVPEELLLDITNMALRCIVLHSPVSTLQLSWVGTGLKYTHRCYLPTPVVESRMGH